MHNDPLEMLHLRCGLVSKLEGHRHMLFTGSGFSQDHLSKKVVKSVAIYLCKLYANAKITKRSFHPIDPDTQQVSKF